MCYYTKVQLYLLLFSQCSTLYLSAPKRAFMKKPLVDKKKILEEASLAAYALSEPRVSVPDDKQSGTAKTEEPPTKYEDRFHYSRIAIETEVWEAMKYRKLIKNESYTDQINNGMRMYLSSKKQ